MNGPNFREMPSDGIDLHYANNARRVKNLARHTILTIAAASLAATPIYRATVHVRMITRLQLSKYHNITQIS